MCCISFFHGIRKKTIKKFLHTLFFNPFFPLLCLIHVEYWYNLFSFQLDRLIEYLTVALKTYQTYLQSLHHLQDQNCQWSTWPKCHMTNHVLLFTNHSYLSSSFFFLLLHTWQSHLIMCDFKTVNCKYKPQPFLVFSLYWKLCKWFYCYYVPVKFYAWTELIS